MKRKLLIDEDGNVSSVQFSDNMNLFMGYTDGRTQYELEPDEETFKEVSNLAKRGRRVSKEKLTELKKDAKRTS